jgi:hypothetical protein
LNFAFMAVLACGTSVRQTISRAGSLGHRRAAIVSVATLAGR